MRCQRWAQERAQEEREWRARHCRARRENSDAVFPLIMSFTHCKFGASRAQNCILVSVSARGLFYAAVLVCAMGCDTSRATCS